MGHPTSACAYRSYRLRKKGNAQPTHSFCQHVTHHVEEREQGRDRRQQQQRSKDPVAPLTSTVTLGHKLVKWMRAQRGTPALVFITKKRATALITKVTPKRTSPTSARAERCNCVKASGYSLAMTLAIVC